MRVPKVLLIQNDAMEPFGRYATYLQERAIEHRILQTYRLPCHASFPSVEAYDACLIGPTPISVRDIEEHGFLRKERAYVAEILGSGKPCLGVCWGAQVLAQSLGAAIGRSAEREIGVYEVRLTREGQADSLFTGFPSAFPVFHWHGDMFEVPPGGRWLVEGTPCPIQAFGWGKVRGLLFHLELEGGTVEGWADAYPAELRDVGKTRRRVVEAWHEREAEMKRLADRLMDNLLQMIDDAAPGSRT